MKSASQLFGMLLLPLILGAPGLAEAAKAKAEGPVAVLPFKDLNKDPEQAWMSRGIAETLVSDLKRVSKLTIVERDQLDRAMSEIAAQKGGGMSTSNAVAVGKLVGARTIVLGSYQRAGPQLRLNARFVQVETGVILDTAKVTGQVKQVFALQDRLVAQLLDLSRGRKKKPRARKRPPETDKTIKAYRLYAMAMTTASDAGQARLLREAVKAEPGFSYALDELDALEARLKAYDAEADRVMDVRAREFRKTLRDPEADAMARWTAALNLLAYFQTTGHQRAALNLAREIYEMKWPAGLPMNARAHGLSTVFRARTALKQYDRALLVGEQYLKEFPGEPTRAVVSGEMARLIEARRKKEQLKTEIDAALAAIDVEEAKLDYEVCEEHEDHEQWEGALEKCGSFLKANTGNAALESQLKRARYKQLEAHLELGRFDEARILAKRLIANHPKEATDRAIVKRMRKWPGATLTDNQPAASQKPPSGPAVAFLPFVRTTDGRELIRLGLVLPRSMTFDIDRGGRQAVLDWDALMKGLDRRPSRGRKITEVKEAAETGQALGADLVILGSYAIEERALEVTARKIDVAKGKVLQEAKAEGTIDEVIVLQDRLLGRLFKDRFVQPDRSPPPPPPESSRKRDPKRGFRLYNLSITGSDTTRFGLLDEALQEDPSLAYARNDYEALVFKAQRGAALARLPAAKLDRALRDRFGREGLNASQRRGEMMELFGLMERTSHQKEILILARRIHAMTWPAEYNDALRANAIYWMQKAHDDFEQHEKVIEMGKLYAKEFPKGKYFSVVTRNGERRVERLAKRAEKGEKMQKQLDRLAVKRIELEGKRCQTLIRHQLYLRGRRLCQRFADRNQSSEESRVLQQVKNARWSVVQSHFELGEFRKARALGLAFVESTPDQSWRAQTMTYWPKD